MYINTQKYEKITPYSVCINDINASQEIHRIKWSEIFSFLFAGSFCFGIH